MEYCIRPVTAEDAGALHALRLTPGIMENLLGIPSWRLDQARGWLENAPYPGVPELLRDLKAAGKELLVATSKPEAMAVQVLEHFGLAQYFEQICGAPSSAPDSARKADVVRRALGGAADPSRAVMVGDRRHDVEGARENGLPCIGVLYGYGGREELEAAGAECVGACIFKNGKDVLPLFADQAQMGGIGLCFQKDKSYCIRTGEGISEEWLLERLSETAGSAGRFVMFDLKEALAYLRLEDPKNCFDATVAAYLLNPLKNKYTYEDVAREQLKILIDEKAKEQVKVCYEAYTAYRASSLLWDKLKECQMDRLFADIEMPLVFTLYDMEKNGVKVEAEALKFYGSQLGSKIAELEKEIYEDAGETFNINSPKQLGVILFENMKLPGGKKTKTGYSTAADVLENLAPDYPIVAKILEYRQYSKLKSTYADGLANYIGEDKRIHSKFNQTITATGRLSSTEPNLQNIPVRMELGRLIRKVFIPEDGYVFVDADYSQIELRVLAHCSGDQNLIEAYREAEDIHRITASQVFHVPFEEVTSQQRRNAKAVNFGIVYGISSFGLSQDLSITRKEAAQYIEDYFKTYPGIKSFLDDTVKHAKEMGYVVTLFGRRRPVPELSSSNFMQRSFGERVAMNAPIQGTAADIIKIAMIGVHKRLKGRQMKSRLGLQVHDELLIEAYQPELSEVKEILREEMEKAVSLDVPLEVDMHTGENWYEAK